jgi:uncharacterized membrane protein YgcG
MEHESFEDQAIAAALNRDFVSIKVDREERPDVDRVYMSFVQATTGSGGWPMTVFLTPELKPFYGGNNEPYENCAMLVDNWNTGYMWFHTAGNVMNKYNTDARVNHMIGKVCEFDNLSPYYAYKTYINTLYYNMSGTGVFTPVVSLKIILLLALLTTGVYLFINLYKQGNRNTTVATTYLRDHQYRMIDKSDIFLNKHVTSRKIETNSGGGSSGGGGVHMSGGGHSYGGGGGRH